MVPGIVALKHLLHVLKQALQQGMAGFGPNVREGVFYRLNHGAGVLRIDGVG